MASEAIRPARRGGKAYLVANLTAQLCALARYVLLARLLGPEQLGIAVAIILTAQFFEAISESGGDRFLIQDSSGDEPSTQRLVHLVWIGRGVIVAAALLLAAGPIADFYDTPVLMEGIAMLALAPLIAGFAHLDYRRLQRESDFRAEGAVLMSSELASLAVTAAAAWLMRDFTAILYGLVTRSAIIVAVSHLAASRRYAAAFAAQHARRLAVFGTPLMLNGLLLFLGGQGDRILIGKEVGIVELGLYSAALLLVYYPTQMLQRYVSAIHLPLVAAHRSRQEQSLAADRLAGQTLLLAVAMAAGFALVAPFAIPLFFGSQFAQPAIVVVVIVILQTCRFLRLWPVTLALGRGRSGIVLLSNLLRLPAFPAAYLALAAGGGLLSVLIAFAAAELIALLITVIVVDRQAGEPLGRGLERVGLFAASSLVLAGWAAEAGQPSLWPGLMLLIATVAIIAWIARREAAAIRDSLAMARNALGRA